MTNQNDDDFGLLGIEVVETPARTIVTIEENKAEISVEQTKQKVILSCKRGPQGSQGSAWIPTDKEIPFDNSDNGYDSDNVHDAIIESRSKCGWITYTSFVGSPKKAPVVFDIPFADSNYGIVISGKDKRVFSVESETRFGFVINTNADQPITASVFWNATSKWG